MDSLDIKRKIDGLVGFEKRFYELLPDECWMSEQTMADLLSDKYRKVGRTRVRRVKEKFIEDEILYLEERRNGKRLNLKHKLWKSYPILTSRERDDSSFPPDFRFEVGEFDDLDLEMDTDLEINWELLQEYTAEDINNMSKLDQLDLYVEAGLLVLPTAYPIFTPNGVECSCWRGKECPTIGKHPVVAYKYLTQYNYNKLKARFRKQFENDPRLNIGFKVMGFSVLDVDYRSGGDLTLADLKYNYDVEMKGVLSVASGNGMHIYADNKRLKNTANVIGKGLDIRSENGFVMASGSTHKNGKTYKWIEIGDVATIPSAWTEEEFIDKAEEQAKIRGEKGNNPNLSVRLKDIKLPIRLYDGYRIPKGQREMTLFKWGCRERGAGADELEIYEQLIAIRDTFCEESETVADREIKELASCIATAYKPNREKGFKRRQK